MTTEEQADLIDALTARLRVDGVPEGVWLLDIAQARQALQNTDDLLLRLSDAIVERTAKEIV